MAFIQRLLGDGLVVLRLERHRVDLSEQVALLDLLPFLEVDRQDLAVDLRAHGHQIARLGRADAFQPYRHVGELGLRCHDRHRAVGSRPPASALDLIAAPWVKYTAAAVAAPISRTATTDLKNFFTLADPVPSPDPDQRPQSGNTAASRSENGRQG